MTNKFDYLIAEIEDTIERAMSIEHPEVKEQYLHEASGMARALSIFIGFSNTPCPHEAKSKELFKKVLDLLYPATIV